MNEVIKFPSIEQYRNIRRNVEWRAQFKGLDENQQPIMDRMAKLPTIKFIGTVKIHGSHADIVFRNGIFHCQSRERVITPEDDNYGFSRWVNNLPKEILKEFSDKVEGNGILSFEWCGKGIQNKVAVCQLDKMAVLLTAKKLNTGEWLEIKDWKMPNEYKIYNIYQFGYYEIEIDFEYPSNYVEKLNEITLNVEKECPVGKFFGISGIGEGVVWAPEDKTYDYSKFSMKIKGSEHSGSKVTKLANVDVEKMKSIEDFVTKVVDEGRLTQGWNYLHENKLFDFEKSMGVFLKWIFNDVIKEEKDTFEASGLKEKDLGGAIAKCAKRWYFEKLSLLKN